MARRVLPIPALLMVLALPRHIPAAEPADSGRTLYNRYCYFCHGYSGDARTLAARFLQPRPRDFTGVKPAQLSRSAMIRAVTQGRPGTAMAPFVDVLTPPEVAAVVDFIRSAFMQRAERNTAYHTPENGWPDHQRYAVAFPFATGELPVDTPWDSLDAGQRTGLNLYLTSCVSCHDRSRVIEDGIRWERQALSYPRFGFKPGDAERTPDAVTGATPFARHDTPKRIEGLTPQQRQGETLYLANCAFCHAADGTGQNWIGRFLRPHPRNFTDACEMAGLTWNRMRLAIRDGLIGTPMPAWKSVLDDLQIDAVIAYIDRAFYSIPTEPGGSIDSEPCPDSKLKSP